MSSVNFPAHPRGRREGVVDFPGKVCHKHKSNTNPAAAGPAAQGGHQSPGTSRASRAAALAACPCSQGCARRMNCRGSAVGKAKGGRLGATTTAGPPRGVERPFAVIRSGNCLKLCQENKKKKEKGGKLFPRTGCVTVRGFFFARTAFSAGIYRRKVRPCALCGAGFVLVREQPEEQSTPRACRARQPRPAALAPLGVCLGGTPPCLLPPAFRPALRPGPGPATGGDPLRVPLPDSARRCAPPPKPRPSVKPRPSHLRPRPNPAPGLRPVSQCPGSGSQAPPLLSCPPSIGQHYPPLRGTPAVYWTSLMGLARRPPPAGSGGR